jgi:flagellar FliL protein
MSIARRACLTLLCLLPLMAQAKSAEKAEEGRPGFAYIEMTPAFVVNFGTTGRIGYLKTDVSLRVSSAAAATVEQHMPALRHELIMLLSSQGAEALEAPEQREALRHAALEAVRKVIAVATGNPPAAGDATPAETGVQDLLFTSFILQR